MFKQHWDDTQYSIWEEDEVEEPEDKAALYNLRYFYDDDYDGNGPF